METENPDVAIVMARLKKLERHTLYLKCAFIVVATILAAGVSLLGLGRWSQAGPTFSMTTKTVETESLVLRDRKGKMRAALEVVDDEPELTLYDERGNPRAVLFVNEKGAFLSLKDAQPQTRLLLAVREDGPAVLLFPENRKAAVEIKVDRSGPRVKLLDDKGKAVFSKP
jgi:hypothetical protein